MEIFPAIMALGRKTWKISAGFSMFRAYQALTWKATQKRADSDSERQDPN